MTRHRFPQLSHVALAGLAVATLAGCADLEATMGLDEPVRAPNGRPGYEIAAEPGQTLQQIAERVNVSTEALAAANRLQPPYTLAPHQVLIVPPPASYRVKAGDTVAAIAASLGVDEEALARANGLSRPYHMRVGQILAVPGGIGGETAMHRGPEPGFEAFNGTPPLPRSTISVKPLPPPNPPPSPANPPVAPPAVPVAKHEPTAATGAPVAIVPPNPPAAAAPPQPAAKPAPPAAAIPPRVMKAPAPPAADDAAPHFLRPVGGAVISAFGAAGGKQANEGINIAAASGTPVRAAEGGTVIYTGNELPAFGNLVLIRHGERWVTAYGHLGSVAVQRNAVVTKGQTIGTVGQTGSVTSPQLHFEIRQNGKPVDPAPYVGG